MVEEDARGMGILRALAISSALLIAALLAPSTTGSAEAVEVLPQGLPTPTSMSTAVWADGLAYVFGGYTSGSLLDTVIQFDPRAGAPEVLEWTLPSERKLAAAAWTGEVVYIIGGVSYDGDPLPEVLRFEPGEGLAPVEGVMPWGTKGVPAVWSGEHIYVFGNCMSAPEGQFDILRYDPVANETEVLEDALPVPGAGSTAVWADGVAYVFGGRHEEGFSDAIIRFEPGSGCTLMEARLPSPRFGATAVWDGSKAYVLGGSNAIVCGPAECVPTDYLDEIVVFDPSADEAHVHWARLPSPRDIRAAVWSGERAYVMGGESKDGPLAEVVVFDPGAPWPEPGDGMDRGVVLFIAGAGGVLFLAVAAWTVVRWKEPPSRSGGLLRS